MVTCGSGNSGVRMADGSIFGVVDTGRPGGPGQFVLQQDPPNHTRLRKLMSQAFRPRATERLRARVEMLVDELLDRAAGRGEMDVIAELALPVPSTVICEMMGVPLADHAKFTEWTAKGEMRHPVFLEGKYDTGFIDAWMAGGRGAEVGVDGEASEARRVACMVAAIAAYRRDKDLAARAGQPAAGGGDPWRDFGRRSALRGGLR